jgi:hypothetical protein
MTPESGAPLSGLVPRTAASTMLRDTAPGRQIVNPRNAIITSARSAGRFAQA